MRDFTNLAWPETPFGADQRPFGRRRHMLAAFGVEWDLVHMAAGELIPVCATTTYLRVTPARPLNVTTDTLPIGFRATLIGRVEELDDLLSLIDRALVRARRHAWALVGHRLDGDLAHLATLTTGRRLPGVEGVLKAWPDRTTKARGFARFVDISDRPANDPTDVDLRAAAAARSVDSSGVDAVAAVERCLAIALAAGRQSGLFAWDGAFDIRDAVIRAGWDVLDTRSKARPR